MEKINKLEQQLKALGFQKVKGFFGYYRLTRKGIRIIYDSIRKATYVSYIPNDKVKE